MEFIIGALIIGVIWFLFGKKQGARQDAAHQFRTAHQGWDLHVSPFNGAVLALSRERGRIVLGTLASYIERDLSVLASVAIEKDGQGLTVANRGSQALGAAVGGVLLGPMGVLIGGLTGSKSHKTRVNQLALKIVIDDPDMPVHRVVFFEVEGPGIDARDSRIKSVAERVEHYYALLSNAIRAQGMSGSPKEALPPAETPTDATVEDRLEKLWRLKDAGAINAEEFELQKARLLG